VLVLLLQKCVRGALKHKTAVLPLTHQVDFLHNADIIYVSESGKYEELLQAGGRTMLELLS
jgi:ATP-binding cassette, subfamily C (CFTR/MRP), member 2